MPDKNLRELTSQWETQMRRGDWEAAWRVSDLIRQRAGAGFAACVPRHLQSIWGGEPLTGKRVLVRCYHGLGDTIQFVRFVPWLRTAASRVILWAQPQLLPLLERVAGIDTLLPLHDGTPAVDYDRDIEIMELPHALRATLATLPAAVPYIGVAPHIGMSAPAVPARPDARPCVGLVYQAGSWNPDRSIAPGLMQRLTSIQGIRWKVMQRGPALSSWPPCGAEIPHMTTIIEEAAQLRALDLLITVDTLSAHLAGALGVRTWTVLPARADWRWMEDREDTPWYPTMRLFRQSRQGDWTPVLSRLRDELACIAARSAVFPVT